MNQKYMDECIVAPCAPDTHFIDLFFSTISRTPRVRDSFFYHSIYPFLSTYGLSLGAMTFDLRPRLRGQNVIFANTSKTARDEYFISIKDIQETIYGLSFDAMTFDLRPRSRGQSVIFANISKTTRDRHFISSFSPVFKKIK